MSYSNMTVARVLGISPAGVSRLRSGDRLPSWSTMGAISECLGWRVQAQVAARLAGVWTSEFERVIRDRAASFDEPECTCDQMNHPCEVHDTSGSPDVVRGS